jgi:hypothetical protein
MSFPDIEEQRMLRAIGVLALVEAALQGEYRACFHGFRVRSWRIGPATTTGVRRVGVEVSFGAELIGSATVDVAVARLLAAADPGSVGGEPIP